MFSSLGLCSRTATRTLSGPGLDQISDAKSYDSSLPQLFGENQANALVELGKEELLGMPGAKAD